MSENTEECCPKFQPEKWDGRQVDFKDKKFVRIGIKSFFHIPLNYPQAIKAAMARIEAAGAFDKDMVMLTDEKSLWGADLYISVTEEVPDMPMSTIEGTMQAKVFDGPYNQIGQWIKQTLVTLKEKGLEVKRLLFWYTTCPKCAKDYGHNYVVVLARVE